MTKTIVVGNHKGGIGKTSLVFNLGHLLSETMKVLLVDTDPQFSLTVACGIGETDKNLARVIGAHEKGDLSMSQIIEPLGESLALAPSGIALSMSELGIVSRLGRENLLRKALATVANDYDLILIDAPPALNLIAINGLTASNGVIAPIIPQSIDLNGLRLYLNTIENIREELNPDLQLIGIVPTFYDSRLKHHGEAIEIMRDGGLPLLPPIGRSVKVAESMDHGQPLIRYDKRNKQVMAFSELASEITKWLKRI